MSNVDLLLDSYQFYSGNPLRGKAVCYFRSDKEIRKIRVRLTCEESTRWTGHESYYDSREKRHKRRTVHYHGRHDFIVSETMLHGEGTLSAGQHEFPFELLLPENMPGTFQHMHGRITFSLTLTVDRPWKIDFESVKEIIIISPLRLPSNFLHPVDLSDEKTVGCFCCASGPVQLDARLEKRAFNVGEHADIQVRCMNMSNSNVNSLDADIKMKLTFKATLPKHDYKYDSELVAISHNTGVGAHGEKTFNMRLVIPPTTVVPNFTGCQLFSSETRLKVNADLSGMHTDLSVSTDVALGHVYCSQLPVPAPMTMPMPLPMPQPGYEAVADKTIGFRPYPASEFSPGPSAPQEFGTPSAPPKSVLAENTVNSNAGNSLSHEPPPPSYEEAAAKNYK